MAVSVKRYIKDNLDAVGTYYIFSNEWLETQTLMSTCMKPLKDSPDQNEKSARLAYASKDEDHAGGKALKASVDLRKQNLFYRPLIALQKAKFFAMGNDIATKTEYMPMSGRKELSAPQDVSAWESFRYKKGLVYRAVVALVFAVPSLFAYGFAKVGDSFSDNAIKNINKATNWIINPISWLVRAPFRIISPVVNFVNYLFAGRDNHYYARKKEEFESFNFEQWLNKKDKEIDAAFSKARNYLSRLVNKIFPDKPAAPAQDKKPVHAAPAQDKLAKAKTVVSKPTIAVVAKKQEPIQWSLTFIRKKPFFAIKYFLASVFGVKLKETTHLKYMRAKAAYFAPAKKSAAKTCSSTTGIDKKLHIHPEVGNHAVEMDSLLGGKKVSPQSTSNVAAKPAVRVKPGVDEKHEDDEGESEGMHYPRHH